MQQARAQILFSLYYIIFFENFGLGETDIICHADNCCGQNMNNYMMQYADWRTSTGMHKTFTVTFLPVGHTKFWPDLYLGLFKKKLRTDKAETISDVCRIAKAACPESNAIIPIATGDESGHVIIPTYDWQSKFQTSMRAIPDLKSYHNFEFSGKGSALCKHAATDPDAEGAVVNIVKNVTHRISAALPDVIQPAPFPLERKKYLAEKIRPYVTDESAKDILCPLPSDVGDDPELVPGVSAAECLANTAMVPAVIEAKRKTPVCGYFKQSGHRNQVRNGVALCPKRKADFEDS